MITAIVGLIAIAAIFRLRKMIHGRCLDGRLFIDKNAKYSRGYMIRGAKNPNVDMQAEREVRSWLYPEQE